MNPNEVQAVVQAALAPTPVEVARLSTLDGARLFQDDAGVTFVHPDRRDPSVYWVFLGLKNGKGSDRGLRFFLRCLGEVQSDPRVREIRAEISKDNRICLNWGLKRTGAEMTEELPTGWVIRWRGRNWRTA